MHSTLMHFAVLNCSINVASIHAGKAQRADPSWREEKRTVTQHKSGGGILVCYNIYDAPLSRSLHEYEPSY